MRRECELPRDTPYICRESPGLMLQIPGVHGETELTWNCIPANVTDRKNDGTVGVRHEEAERRSVRSPGSGVSPWPTRRDTVNGTEARRARALVVSLASRARLSTTTRRAEVATTILVVDENFPASLTATATIFQGSGTGRFYARRQRHPGLLTRRGASHVASTIVNMPTNRLRVVLSSVAR